MATNDDQVPGPSKKAQCWGESIVDLQNIVKILVKDAYFIENWKEFYYSLEQPSPKFVQWDRSFKNNTMTVNEILNEMLSHWVMVHGKEAKVGRLYDALSSEKFMAAAEALTDKYESSYTIVEMTESTLKNSPGTTNSDTDTPISFHLCEPTGNFVGRTNELQMLDTFHQQKAKLVVVSGLGGVGKSELVRKFGITFLKDVRGNCIWIQGDNEESVQNSIKRLADYVSLKLESDSDIVEGFEKVYNSKLKHRPILIIVDNVDKSNRLVVKLIKGCKPLLNNVPLIIVTTRNKSALQIEGGNIELKMLEENEAVQMVTNGLVSGVSLSEATKLCHTLGHFPLIIQQAISFIKQKRCDPFEQNFSVSEYLELFDKQKEKLMDSALSIDDNYNSTTFATWGMILDNLKQMNGSTGLLAVNILRILPYFNANGVSLCQLVRCFQDDNMPHKTCIGSQSDQSRLDSEEIKEAIRLIEAYSMCQVDRSVNTGLGGDLGDYNISSHRLIRDFMLLCTDTEMDKEITRRLFFVGNVWISDKYNVDKLAQTNKTLVVELFTKCWNLDVDDEQSCPSHLEIHKTKFYKALETDGLNKYFALNSEHLSLRHSRTMVEDFHTINQYVRRRYGSDHLLSRTLMKAVTHFIRFESKPDKFAIDISIGVLVEMIFSRDDGLLHGKALTDLFRSVMQSLLTGRVPIEMTNHVMELKESVTNCYNFNENYEQFTFSILTAIAQFFKLNKDIDRFNEIQSEMSCLMQHPSELKTIWYFIKHCSGYSSSLHNFIFDNIGDMIDDSILRYLDWRLYISPHSLKTRELLETVDNFFYESKRICYLDLFAIVTMAMDNDEIDIPSDILTKVDSYLIDKDLIIRVIQTIMARSFNKNRLLYTEITESVRNGLVNSYEGIWSLGQIYKVLWDNRGRHIDLIDTLEGLANTEKDKELVKTILYSITDGFVWDGIRGIKRTGYEADKKDWSDVIPLFLRLQKYGLYFPILKQILHSASVEQIVTIGSNIIDNHRKGLINKPDTFLAIKQVVKSFLKKGEKEKALEILCQCLNIENLIPSDGNQGKLLFEKVQSTVVYLGDINIAIAAFFYFRECVELDDPREYGYPCILLLQTLKILCKEENPTKLFALCYEIYHVNCYDYTLECWCLIQILKRIVEMNRKEFAERFLKKIIKERYEKNIEYEEDYLNRWLCYYKACFFLVLGTHYKAGLDTESTSEILIMEKCVKNLEWYNDLIKDKFSTIDLDL